MAKRTKVTITVSRTIQLQPYTPAKIEVSTEIEDEVGIDHEEIKYEEQYLRDFVDSCINDMQKQGN